MLIMVPEDIKVGYRPIFLLKYGAFQKFQTTRKSPDMFYFQNYPLDASTSCTYAHCLFILFIYLEF